MDFIKKDFKIIAFDADDTLWENENHYQQLEQKFCGYLSNYAAEEDIKKQLFNIEMQNLELYGYGAKAFILSLIETALLISNNNIPASILNNIIADGKKLILQPIILLDGVQEALKKLQNTYTLVVATKGDLLDQERKLLKSGLSQYFHHIEIMSDKNKDSYLKLLNRLDIQPSEFLMVGNSFKSDIMVVLEIGGSAVYIPFHTTWAHEHVEKKENVTGNYIEVASCNDLINILL